MAFVACGALLLMDQCDPVSRRDQPQYFGYDTIGQGFLLSGAGQPEIAILFAQRGFQQLAGGGVGQCIDEQDFIG